MQGKQTKMYHAGSGISGAFARALAAAVTAKQDLKPAKRVYEYDKVPSEKVEAVKAYAAELHKKYPAWSQERIKRKTAEYFHIKRIA